jgi:transglutaminase-like putative cysteine protease
MGLRLGQLAGIGAFGLGLLRLGRLLDSGPEYPAWQLIFVASAFLGGVAWWLLTQLTTGRKTRITVFALGGLFLVLRISVPQTLIGGIVPGVATPGVMGAELSQAWHIVQSGIPPVEPQVGVLAILALFMWAGGALFAWGSSGGPYAALFVPPLVFYLQSATFDRQQPGFSWILGSTVVLVIAVVSVALERHHETGRARDSHGIALHRRSARLAAVMAAAVGIASIGVANNASGLVPTFGNLRWQGGSGLGTGPGTGITFDGLVDLRQRIIDRSNVPVFTARFAADTPPDLNPYWVVDRLDSFDGEEWRRSDGNTRRYDPDLPVVDSANLYQGTVHEILQTVQIQNLNTILAPTAGTPVELQDPSPNASNPRSAREFLVVGGVSIGAAGGLRESDQYQLRTMMPDRVADLGTLATNSSGELSPIFAAAAEAGDFPYQPRLPGASAVLADRARYVALPNDTPTRIANLARSQVAGSTTEFEAAWMLQSWFRDSGDFTYSIEVSTGHGSLVLDEWLSEPDSINFRTGYCEQFAAAMAVLLRSLDIPARVVWGFTPGEVDSQGIITVRDTNAHAWVEAWIEPYGWFQFDPTPRSEQTGFALQPPSITAGLDPTDYIEAPVDRAPGSFDPRFPDQDFIDLPPVALEDPATRTTRWWLLALTALVPLAAAIPIVKRVRRRRRLVRLRNGDITAAWDEIVDRLTDLGMHVPASLTPVELARTTDKALLPLAYSYSATVYGGRSGQGQESDLVLVEWRLNEAYSGSQRARASLSLRSLLKG